ncbi:SMP-30/gluconolactonase/LRE family protein [Ramlibacter albus]|uniref:SMP-30/gluconolactonase/LRE family protein n=1 Tax=Ramlibacter albus TaxID=2079448 RepID=A0A923S0Y7_9BURK|nr:SMP-30/gluconolactonase/LRE family protein [Ramlibacter albus]MBC5763864.1 SMP-30/gluconolactonase/LRE family protein [Ramlibacter albus]
MQWQPVVGSRDGLGESPFWHPDEQMLYWVDIPNRQVRRANVFMGTLESWEMPLEPGCIAPAAGGGLVIALRDGIYRARGWGEALLCIARFSHDTKTTRFNDGKADALGRFWAGTMYEPRDARKAELYCIDCRPDNAERGKTLIQLKAQNAVIANGLAWSPDNRTIYWSDTTNHVIHAWDWDAAANVMRGHRVFAQFPAKPAGWQPRQPGYGGRPDGAAVDAEGNYWVAMFEGGRLLKLSPRGEVLQEVPVPVRCPTMPCFGGDDLQTLYVTSAGTQRGEAEVRELPLSGIVMATRVEVPGLRVNFFIDS